MHKLVKAFTNYCCAQHYMAEVVGMKFWVKSLYGPYNLLDAGME